MSELELTVSRKIAASREKIFNAWLSPTALAKFMKTPAGNFDARNVTTDPVKGGRFMIVMVTPEREIPHSGTYLEVDPYSRLSFTWESPHSLDDSVVTIDLKEIGPETTELTLKQVKFRSEGARDGHIQGWNSILGELDKYLG
ncbi:SRPBCC domain-containing protein [Rhizobium sp. 2MFCol3.1]|uniref:SRPBCC family protein n=1 Tax=Rhizobium sp. 2MFCol3.1 TaxID=1246459 RepID=UPI0003803C9C|nr:SRPBCC domain-containing protein [Rhizobium sp. 2MFCol3.1]